MNTYTPDSWVASGRYVETEEKVVCEIFQGYIEDAYLIAAAPENYESNKELAAIVRELCGAYGHPLPKASLNRSDAAIAKAEGKL